MKILFIYQSLASFVEKDLEILKEKHDVREVRFTGGKRDLILNLLPDIYRLIIGIMWCDVTFSWFGKLHAFFAVLFSKIFGKKSIVVAGGDDVACVPEINYGMFSYWWKKWCPLFVFRYADLIFTVSKFNERETLLNAKADPEKIRMIYHGFSSDIFKKNPSIEKENIVITIGSVSNERKTVKGLKLFVDSAKLLPDVNFLLIGPDKDGTINELRKKSSENVQFLGGIYGQDLIDLCSRAKVYVQVSIHESFGCSLAEAMLCECIPVVSANAAIPEVVGDTGVYVDELLPEKVAEKIEYALTLPDDFGMKARNRIKTLFSLDKRREQLIEAMSSL